MSWVVYNGWVKVRNFMNKSFPEAAKPCAICSTAKRQPIWYNLETAEVRCMRCFKPPGFWI